MDGCTSGEVNGRMLINFRCEILLILMICVADGQTIISKCTVGRVQMRKNLICRNFEAHSAT